LKDFAAAAAADPSRARPPVWPHCARARLGRKPCARAHTCSGRVGACPRGVAQKHTHTVSGVVEVWKKTWEFARRRRNVNSVERHLAIHVVTNKTARPKRLQRIVMVVLKIFKGRCRRRCDKGCRRTPSLEIWR